MRIVMVKSFSIRFLTRIDLRKDSNDIWKVTKQEDSLPSDYASTGLRIFPFDREISNLIKVRSLFLFFLSVYLPPSKKLKTN